MADLRTRLAGLELRNPLLLASGIWGESGVSLAGAWEAGAGGVITKSIGGQPRPGYPNPTIEELDRWGFLNAMGLPNPGIAEFPREVEQARARGALVIGSVFGHDPAEFAELAGRLADTGVLAIELNLSCPHAEGVGAEVGSDPGMVQAITREVVRCVRVPVIAKLTPNTHDIAALAVAAELGGASAVSAINTVRAMAIDAKLRRPILSHGLGGLSGPAIKPIGLACVWQIYPKVHIPIVGVGGITTASDALEYLFAGATALQIGTALVYRGVRVFTELPRELSRLMDELAIPSVASAVGAAHRPPAAPTTAG